MQRQYLPGASYATSSAGLATPGSPGKRTLTEALSVPAPIQARPGRLGAADQSAESVSEGSGKVMPRNVQDKMEASFGVDFSAVRIHEDSRSEALHARAFTKGADIHFAPGEYQPASMGGQELLGHELAHVVQQRQGRVQATTQAEEVDINDDSGLEREADEMGYNAARGEPARAVDEQTMAEGAVTQPSIVQQEIGDDINLDLLHDDVIEADADEADETDEEAGATVNSPLVEGKPPGAVQMKRAGKPRSTGNATLRQQRRARRLTIQQAIGMYAPVVFLAKGEKNGPSDAGVYISRSSLHWSDSPGGDEEVADRGEINPRALGSGGYEHDGYDSNDNVRPKDGRGDGGHEGFFLNLPNDDRDDLGFNLNPPVYHQAVDGRFITYWFFYAYNDGPGLFGVDNHEGDWERIVVKLNSRNRATYVAYYQHDSAPEIKPWKSVPRQGTHPKVYSAKGSHASYSAPGEYDLPANAKDTADRGREWRTWNNMKNVRGQGWYRYGGAWGEVGDLKSSTGPQGPSRHKPPAPKGW